MFTGQRPMPGPGDVLFTDEDRALVLEWQAEQRLIHPPCGQPLDIAVGTDNDGAWITDQHRCHACAARESTERAIRQEASQTGDHPDGLIVVPVHRPDLRPNVGR